MAGIDVLAGHDDGEGHAVGRGLGLGVAGVLGVGIPPAQVVLGLVDGGGVAVAVLDVAQDGVHVQLLAHEGHGLGIAVDDLDALLAQALVHTVRGHAQADAHVEQAVGGVAGHVVGDGGAVHKGVAAADHGVLVGVIGAAHVRHISAGQAGRSGQNKVGAVGAGGVVGTTGVVGVAVGVENHQAALGHGARDVVYSGVGHGVTHGGAAGGLGQALPHGLVAGGIAVEGGVGVVGGGFPEGLDQTDLRRTGNAAANFGEGRGNGGGLFLRLGDLSGGGVVFGVVEQGFHTGRVAAGNA